MKEMDLCILMSKEEFDEKNAVCLNSTAHEKYESGQMIFIDGCHYINISKNTCYFDRSTNCWKQVIMNDSINTKGFQDFDENGQPYTATNLAPNAE